MNLKGYKWNKDHSKISADILEMLPKEKASQFIERCKKLGYTPEDKRNLINWYKFYDHELLIDELELKRNPNLFVLCQNVLNDFNVCSILRSCNLNAVKETIIFGDKRLNYRTGSVGALHYEKLSYCKTLDNLDELLTQFEVIVAIDNVENSKNLATYKWQFDKKTLIIFGNEAIGITPELLEKSQDILYIKQAGCLRSMSVAQAAAVVLYDYNTKLDSLSQTNSWSDV